MKPTTFSPLRFLLAISPALLLLSPLKASYLDPNPADVRDATTLGGAMSMTSDFVESFNDAAGPATESTGPLSSLDNALAESARGVETGTPPIPSSCAGNDACADCFEEAFTRLARSRILLARAKALYDATHQFHKKAVALGDNLAPMTKEAAIVWTYQKPGIDERIKRFDETYDRKVDGMLGGLKEALMAISNCEARHGGVPDWFTLYGFMYLEFMEARYRRDKMAD